MTVNLSHAEQIDSIQGGQEQIVAALEHVERVLREKAKLFNKSDARRRKPPEFEGVALKDAVCWLFVKCGTLQPDCRHQCIKMVDTLTPLLQDYRDAAEFVSWYIDTHSISSLVKICEGNQQLAPDASSLVHVTHWLHELLMSLECYVWMFGRKLIQPSRLFATGELRIIEAVVLFVEKVSWSTAGAVVNVLSSEPDMEQDFEMLTSWETENYNTSKCSVIVRVLDFISQVAQNNSKDCITPLLEKATLWKLVAACVFHPAALGFDLRKLTIQNNLADNLIEFLKVLQKSLSSDEMSELRLQLETIVDTMKVEVVDNLQDILVNGSFTTEQKQFLQGLNILQQSELLGKLESHSRFDGTKIVQDVFSSLVEERNGSKVAVIVKPSSQELAELLVRFAFLLHDSMEIVIRCLKDSTVIENPVTKVSLRHGEHFFTTLHSAKLDYMAQESAACATLLLQDMSTQSIHWVLSIFTELVQHVARIRTRDKVSSCLTEVIVNNWNMLSGVCETSSERIYELLGLLINLAKITGNAVGVFKNRKVIWNWVVIQLGSQQLQLSQKTRVLDLLVCLTGPQDDDNITLKNALQSFRDQHMPCMSEATAERAGFVPAFKRILQALEDSGSRVILHSVVSMAARENNHVCEDEIQQSLHKFIRRLDFSNQVKSLEVVYKLFLDEDYDPDVRLNCALRFIQPLLQGCRAAAAREFYRRNISMLQNNLINIVLDKRGGFKVEHQLVGKIGAWSLLELLFVHFDCSELESKECAITMAAFPGAVKTGKELILDLSTKAFNYRKEKLQEAFVENNRLVELFRKSQCAAFNALVAIISNTKTDEKFYTGLIFNVNSATKEYVWKCLVDCNRSYVLTLDWAEIPKRRKHLVSIRREARSHRREVYGSVSQTVRYIPSVSQYLFDSTLNEDVTMFDLSTSVVCAEAGEEATDTSESTEVNLEADDLNKHECMATLCGMIRHMVDKGISPPGVDKLPPWMAQLQKCLEDSRQMCNVRLFLMKAILNTEDKFRPYARLWINTILKVIDDGVVGITPNYLLSDVVAMLVDWKGSLTGPFEVNNELLNQLLELLVRNVEHSRRDVFKHNLELIRTVVELWKQDVAVSYQLLHDMMMRSDPKDPRVSEPGIQVCAILLSNGVEPWNSSNKQEFMSAALRHMDGEKREIYQSSGEVVGLSLKLVASRSDMTEPSNARFLTSVTDKLNVLREKSKSKFITCLFAIQEHYQSIVRPYIRHILFHLPKLCGIFRIMCLKIVYSRLELQDDETVEGDVATDEMYAELKLKGLFKFLTDRDPDQQILTLQILDKMVGRLDPPQVAEVVQEVQKLHTHHNKHCRSLMYNIVMWVYDYCQDLDTATLKHVKSTLLKGLRDDDPFLQDMIFKYWLKSPQLKDAVTWRHLAHIMSELYSSSTEDIFLGYLTQLLLETTVDTPDYKLNIFKAPLSKCEFKDIEMILSWRAQHTTAAPMFADTLASRISQSQSLSSASPLVRSTQNTLAFQPTLAQDNVSLSISSSLLFSTGSVGASQRRSYKMGPGFGSRKLTLVDEVDAPKHTASNLRRRFTREDHLKRNFYAGQEIKRNERRKQLEEERGRRREANIASFRSYRIGDFPDIEIPNSAVIKPLQELAKRVPTVAREVFVLVLDSLLSELSGEEREAFTQRTQEAMNNILCHNKEQCLVSPVLVGAVMQVALHNPKHFSFNPELVAAASQESGLLALGSLVLEETLVHADDSCDAGPSKRSRDSGTNQHESWVLLAELYRAMNEWDVVHGIFHSYLSCGDDVKEAIKWEASGNWSKAKKMYAKSLSNMETDGMLSDYCYEAYYKCLANMSDWETLNKEIRKQVEKLDDLWDDWYQEKLLPQFVLSEVHVMLEKGNRQEFVDKVTEWLSDREKSSWMSNCMSEELAMIFLLQDDLPHAGQQVEHTLNAFLTSWADLNPLSHKLRARQLLDLHKTAEIQAYLTVSDEARSRHELVRRWNNTLPSPTDPVLMWDARAMYRKKFAQHMEDMETAASLTRTQLALVDLALCQNNFSVARKYLEQTIAKRDVSGEEFRLEWNFRFVKAKWLEMQLKDDVNKQFEMKLKCWDLLESRLEKAMDASLPELYVKTQQHVCTITKGILEQIMDEPDVITHTPDTLMEKLVQRVSAPDRSKEVLVDCLKKYGLKCLKDTVSQKNVSSIAQAYLEVAKYCKAYCSTSLGVTEFGSEIITSVLRAMKYGSWEARHLFPCILQLPGLGAEPLSNLFLRESSEVPTWMFLGWVNQLLACLNTPIGPVLHNIVSSLVQMYPQAVMYGFQVSQENYELGSEQHNLKNFVNELRDMLFRNSVMETFLRAFACLGQPCKMLDYFIRRLKTMIEEPQINRKSLSFVYDTMMKELFCSRSGTRIHGKAFQDIEKFQSILQKAETKIKQGNKNALKDLDQVLKGLHDMNRKAPQQVKDYSPWLSEFQDNKYGRMDLEIPGQYTGESRPLPQHHIKIVGFKQTVEIMKSKAMPMVLTVLGSDGKEHKYLVKFGEDLRQDQRLEQLFNLMNKILGQNPLCRQRNLEILTYQVVPVSSHIGIVEWVNGTKVLSDFITDTLEPDEGRDYDSTEVQYNQWISAKTRGNNISACEVYGEAHLKYTRIESIAAFREKVNLVPWDVLRRAVLKLSLSPESYFALRHNFACSYAVMCIAHWLLGIGDRHLNNTLVTLKDGRCVGVDFGLSFGAATQFLPVPELIPFRLTPHIVNLLQPLQEVGLLRETMIHSLRTLRNDNDLLLATMEVFVREPSMDWLDWARKHETLNKDLEQTREGGQEWYPQQKLDAAKLKFEGANPAYITHRELEQGFKNSKYLHCYLEAARGVPAENVRARLPELNLSPEQQVDCLVDQAMDYNILSKTWIGWKPWV